ncbi:hypothetical protein AMEX_G2972 [Astyanax mexicanus]|uniref:Uncharacterized protein n=1 Tax=Astyanax mexicanus TaxID=7994 RepID=A0A8T2MAW5_ASTMX|nr:hypothetical protein AMEX_G2972 [Astyanax mexicanus]
MPGITTLTTGTRRSNEKERFLANALRMESLHLCRRLRLLGLQHQRELARVSGAQLELRKALDRLKDHGPPSHPALTRPAATSTDLNPLCPRGQPVVQSCCPNHIVCSNCNLRLRLADQLTRRFTPGLWTMYCQPLITSCPGDVQPSSYRMPKFMERRNISTLDKSLRYLPFL